MGKKGNGTFVLKGPFNDWEMERVEDFINVIKDNRINPFDVDIMMWKLSKDGLFSVKPSFDALEGRREVAPFLNRMFWNQCVPSNVGFFSWEARWDWVMTMDQLKKRGFSLASRCPFCGKDKENIEHLLIHCPMIWGIWTSLLAALGIAWVPPLFVQDLIVGLERIPVRKDERQVWRVASL